MSRLAKGIDGLEGVHGHVNLVPLPEMKGIEKKDLKILIFTKLTEGAAAAPAKNGGGKAPKKSGKTEAATETKVASPATASSVDGAEDRATEVILNLLAEKGGKVGKGAIPQAMFAAIKDNATLRNACIALGGKADWLSSGDRPWAYDGGELSLG
jgi:hypothetical protein